MSVAKDTLRPRAKRRKVVGDGGHQEQETIERMCEASSNRIGRGDENAEQWFDRTNKNVSGACLPEFMDGG